MSRSRWCSSHRPLPGHPFQAVGVNSAWRCHLGADLGSLRLDDAKRASAIIAPQHHLIDVANALGIGHSGDQVFGHVLPVRVPTGLANIRSMNRSRVSAFAVVGNRNGLLVGGLDLLDFRPQSIHLLLKWQQADAVTDRTRRPSP